VFFKFYSSPNVGVVIAQPSHVQSFIIPCICCRVAFLFSSIYAMLTEDANMCARFEEMRGLI